MVKGPIARFVEGFRRGWGAAAEEERQQRWARAQVVADAAHAAGLPDLASQIWWLADRCRGLSAAQERLLRAEVRWEALRRHGAGFWSAMPVDGGEAWASSGL